MAKKRAAVVIGVNKTGELPTLQGSATGAEAVAAWLRKEGFDLVQVFTDVDANGDNKEVTAAMLKTAVKGIVLKGIYSQLVIFFSGHGYWKNDNEFWLLTNAPQDSEEAISWTETAELAKGCGISNVVLISDACRTMPATPTAMRIRGSVLIPNTDQPGPRSKVDKYLAAVVTNPAYELKLVGDEQKTSVFTYCLLDAFSEPAADTVVHVTEAGKQFSVIPNRRLAVTLERRVPELLQSIKATYEQHPDAEVLSDDDAYIARAGPVKATPVPETALPGVARVTIKDVAAIKVRQKLEAPLDVSARTLDAINRLARDSGFAAAVNDAGPVDGVESFETETGLTVRGAGIAEIAVSGNAEAKIFEGGSAASPGIARLKISSGVASVGLRFSNGRGTVIAGLPGYIAHITVDANAVVAISYVPSKNNFRWTPYSERRQIIEALRATTAAAARKGVFRLNDKVRAQAFAETARTDKAFDPALGIYSAYAYWQADDQDAITSVLEYMYRDLNASIFDVALLAGDLRGMTNRATAIAPFCPMLTQGWNLLRLRKIELPKIVAEAQDELEAALWTTFKPSRAAKIIKMMKGEY
ncbi:caspase family protein [Mesorhizobium sp. M0924]|uniref:caspase family protein n=1 Tax=unclassified Mesorhizobium TaxID=325217 RepID=UPI003334EA0A